jgi:hypothetical protein
LTSSRLDSAATLCASSRSKNEKSIGSNDELVYVVLA